MRSALNDAKKLSERAFKQIVGGAMFGAGRPTGVASTSSVQNLGPMRMPAFAPGLEEKVMNRCATGDPV